MKNKKIISIIAIFFACMILVSGYTADNYINIQSTLRNDYVVDTYTDIDSTFGSDEIVDTCPCPTSGNWNIDCADNCDLSLCNMKGNNVLIDSVEDIGVIINMRNIKNATRIRIQGGCVGKW